jgi:hypothetical protein
MAERWEKLDAEQLAGARRLRWFLAGFILVLLVLAVLTAVGLARRAHAVRPACACPAVVVTADPSAAAR